MANCHKVARSVFGGRPLTSTMTYSEPLNIFLTGTFFASFVIWSGYRASLTSKLVKTDLKMPFNNLEEFLHSDFRFVLSTGRHM